MSSVRTERLFNLVIALLSTNRYLTREKIHASVQGYEDCATQDAFERMFERDKLTLREMGIPLETGSNDVLFDDEIGYRIPRDAYWLPDISFEPDELIVLGLAARVWQQATMAAAVSSAVLKLEANGVDVDPDALSVIEPRVAAAEPTFGSVVEAIRDRRPVRFPYRRSADPQPTDRDVQPWGVVSWHGRWYLVGHDLDRGATRVFRLSRITGAVTAYGAPGSVAVPDDVDLLAAVRVLAPDRDGLTATLRISRDRARPLRLGAASIHPDQPAPGWDTVSRHFTDLEEAAREICGFGADVVVDGPPALRSAVVRRLDALLATTAGSP